MAEVKNGDQVKVHYTGKLPDGTVFDSSMQREALQFTVGEGQLISGFEKAVMGMEIGQEKTFTISAADAYGLHNQELVFNVARDSLPANVDPSVGQRFQIRQKDGSVTAVTVAAIAETNVTFDANHPLAGKDLTFDIQLVEIV